MSGHSEGAQVDGFSNYGFSNVNSTLRKNNSATRPCERQFNNFNSSLRKKISADTDCSMILRSRGLALAPTFATFPLAGMQSAILSVASLGLAYRRWRGLSAGVERRQFRDERAVAERLG
jgi:hypothetical protein